MARFVFFSFADDDVKNFKVNVVRNSWLLKNKEETFVDGSIWEKSKTKGDAFLKNLIETVLKNTSVTVVLIGEDTANRRWVNYEIEKSFDKGNSIFGIHINRVKRRTGLTARGQNPLDRLGFKVSEEGNKIQFYELSNNKWRPLQTYPKSTIKSQTQYTLIIIGGKATSLENSFDSRTNSRHFVGTLIMDNKTFILGFKNQQNKQDDNN